LFNGASVSAPLMEKPSGATRRFFSADILSARSPHLLTNLSKSVTGL
jgi:hypothetical protein